MPDPTKRLQMLDKMIAAGTSDPFVRYARALELRGMGDLEGALTALEDVHTRHPEYVPTFLMAAQIATDLDRRDQARTWLTDGLRAAVTTGDEHARSELQSALDAL